MAVEDKTFFNEAFDNSNTDPCHDVLVGQSQFTVALERFQSALALSSGEESGHIFTIIKGGGTFG